MKIKMTVLSYLNLDSMYSSLGENSVSSKMHYDSTSAMHHAIPKFVSTALISLGSLLVVSSLVHLTNLRSAIALIPGNYGEEVEFLQEQLYQANFFRGEITGYYGPITESAVSSFQASRGLVVDGIAGEVTLRNLADFNRMNNNRARRGNTTPGRNTQQPEALIHLLSDVDPGIVNDLLARVSTDLEALQRELERAGFYKGEIDGVYGSLTETAIIGYAFSTLLPDRESDVMRMDDAGPLVREIQEKLRALGYLADDPDGIFGPRTEAAVIQFQHNASLAADGMVGPFTLAELRRIFGEAGLGERNPVGSASNR